MRSDGGGGADAAHVLVLSWDFAPFDSSLSRRARALAVAAVGSGAEVTVVTVDRPPGPDAPGHDPSLAGGLDGVAVVTVVDDHPDLHQEIDAWSRERAVDPAGWRDEWLARASAGFDEPGYGHLLSALIDGAAAVHAEHAVDVVVALSAPMVTAVAALEVAQRCGARLVIDLARVGADRLHLPDPRVALALSAAEMLSVPDASTRERLGAVLPDRADEAWLVPDSIDDLVDAGTAASRRDGPLRVGAFVEPDAWGDLTEVVEGWIAARLGDPALADAELLVHGRPPADETPRIVLGQGAAHGVTLEASPPVAELAGLHRSLDLLVVASRGDLPAGRTTDHLRAGRPIVWCTAEPPAEDHALNGFAHVLRSDDLSSEALAAAFSAAVRLEPSAVRVPQPTSPWPDVVRTMLAEVAP